MEDKIRKERDIFDPPVTIGIVGHCRMGTLQEIKRFFQELEGFDTVYLKTTSGKLWIKEGDSNDK